MPNSESAASRSLFQRVSDFISGPREADPKGAKGALVARETNPGAEMEKFHTDLTLQYLLQIGSEFTPADVRNLRTRARWGDVRYLCGLYDEFMRLGPGPQVRKMIEAIRDTEDQYLTTPEDLDDDSGDGGGEDLPAKQADAAKDARDYVEQVVTPWAEEIKAHMVTAELYGFAAGEIRTDPRGMKWRGEWRERIVDFRPIAARRFRLDPVSHEWLLTLDPLSMEGVPVLPLVQRGKLLWMEVGKDTEPLDQRGLFFQCLVPWAIMQFCVRWRAKRVELYGVPPRIGYTDFSDANTKAEMENMLRNMGAQGFGIFPEGSKVEFVNALAQGRIDPQAEQIEWCARQFDLILLGDTQASGVQVGAGSRTSKKEAIAGFSDLTNARARKIATQVFNRQLIPGLVLRNIGEAVAAENSPIMTSAVVEEDDAKALADTALALAQAGYGEKIDAEDTIRRCTLQVADEDAQAEAAAKAAEANAARAPAAEPAGVTPEGAPQAPGGRGGDLHPGDGGERIPAAGGAAGASRLKLVGGPGKGRKVAASTRGGRFAFMTSADVQVPHGGGFRPPPAGKGSKRPTPRVRITSFGHDVAAAPEAAATYDARVLAPEWGEDFPAARTGRDREVANKIEECPGTEGWYTGVLGNALKRVTEAKNSGANDLDLAVGCDHGRHRSVYVAERLANDLRLHGHDATAIHRDAMDPEMTAARLPGHAPATIGDLNLPGGETETFGITPPGKMPPARVAAEHMAAVKIKEHFQREYEKVLRRGKDLLAKRRAGA